MVAAIGLIAVGVFVYKNSEFFKKKLNPASDQNLIYQSDFIQGTIGATMADGYTVSDHIFAAIDVINPFNESDEFAKKVLFE